MAVYDIADAQRAALAQLDTTTFAALSGAYKDMAVAVHDAYRDYGVRLAAWQANHPGESLDTSPARHYAYQQVRLKELLDSIGQRQKVMAEVASTYIASAQQGAWVMAGDDFGRAWRAHYEPSGYIGIAGSMGTPPDDAFESLVGFLSDGSPLKARLSRNGQDAYRNAANVLETGLSLGWNANKTAKALAPVLNEPHWKALRIARTETHRAYNEAMRLHILANGAFIKGWRWRAAGDERTCAACYAMHGTMHEVDFVPKGDVPQGAAQHKGLTDTFRSVEPVSNPSEPPPPVGGTATQKAIHTIEAAHRGDAYETATFVDPGDGHVVWQGRGTSDGVSFGDDVVAQARGSILTHNHPRGWGYAEDDLRRRGSSFSLEDLRTAWAGELAELRVVTPGFIASLKPAQGGAWNQHAAPRYQERYAQVEAAVRSEFYAAIRNGTMTRQQAEAHHYGEVTRRMASEFGWEYTETMA